MLNKGLLCVKGCHVGMVLYGEDRLRTPLLRKDGQLVPILWDEATGIIAKKINATPQKFAFYGSGQWTIPGGYAANKFMKGGLSNNHIDPNAYRQLAQATTKIDGLLLSGGLSSTIDTSEDDSLRGQALSGQ